MGSTLKDYNNKKKWLRAVLSHCKAYHTVQKAYKKISLELTSSIFNKKSGRKNLRTMLKFPLVFGTLSFIKQQTPLRNGQQIYYGQSSMVLKWNFFLSK